jgi:hypothetical protein
VRRLNGSESMWRLRKSRPKGRGLYPRTATDQLEAGLNAAAPAALPAL